MIFTTNAFGATSGAAKADSLKRLLEQEIGDSLRLTIYHKLSHYYMRMDPKQSLAYGSQELELAAAIDDKYWLATANLDIAKVQNYLGNHLESEEKARKALLFFQQSDDAAGIAEAYSHLGRIYGDRDEYAKSLEFHLKALNISEKIGDQQGIAHAHNNMGIIYWMQKDYDNALAACRKSLDMKEQLGDRIGLSTGYNNIGGILLDKGDQEQAMQYFQRSLEIKKALGLKRGMALLYNNIGTVYLEQGQLNKARQNHQQALAIQEEIGNRFGMIYSLRGLGEIYTEEKKYAQALGALQKSNKIARMLEARSEVSENYRSLSEIYQARRMYREALNFHELYAGLKDSIFNEQSNERIEDMKAKYESEKKEREIDLLTKDNAIRELEMAKKDSDLKRQQLLIYGVIVGFVLLLILAFVLYNRNQLKQKANQELEARNRIIAKKNKQIMDSINYAQQIQEAILPSEKILARELKDHFIYYLPRDVVSGDFFWVDRVDNLVLVAAVDCTGHGVPGAFMSIIGYNQLNQAVKEHRLTEPAAILNEVNKGVTASLRQKAGEGVKDGMDIALCCLDPDRMKLQFAGAFNPLYLVRNRELTEIKANRFPIGIFLEEEMKTFTNQTIDLEPGDQIYLFSDGYADQFGGPDNPPGPLTGLSAKPAGKKFNYRRFKQLIVEISQHPMAQQHALLDQTLLDWRGSQEQIDDILVMGIRV